MRHPLRARREARLAERDAFRVARRLVDEDVTVFGEQVGDLHVQTLTDELTEPMHVDYQAALTAYDDAKAALAAADSLADVGRVDEVLTDGRFRLACVLARRDGRPLPQRRDPCFFNPQHGPASRDLAWTPPGGVARDIPVCFRCGQRLEAGEAPDQRLVRRGDRWIPWYAAGGSFDEYVRVDAHVVRGSAWLSRTAQAEAMAQASSWIGQSGI